VIARLHSMARRILARPATSADRGYTIVEVLVVIAITVIGFLAMANLQASVLRANQNSWNTAGAVHLAQHVQEAIRLEGLEWTNDSFSANGGVGQTKFRYLRHVGAPVVDGTSGWLDAGFYPADTPLALVNQVGRGPYDTGALALVPQDRNQRFCVRFRLTWIIPNFLIRSDVRVLWARPESQAGLYDACPGPEGRDAMEAHPEDVFSIAFPATVMKNVFVSP